MRDERWGDGGGGQRARKCKHSLYHRRHLQASRQSSLYKYNDGHYSYSAPRRGSTNSARARGARPSPFRKRGVLSTRPRTSCRAWCQGHGTGRDREEGHGLQRPRHQLPLRLCRSLRKALPCWHPHREWFLCQPRAKEMDDMSARRDCAVPGRAISLCFQSPEAIHFV